MRRTHWRKLPTPQVIIDKMNVLAGDKLITAADITVGSKNQTDMTERIIPMVETHQRHEVPTVETVNAEEAMALQDKTEQVAVEVQEEQIEAEPIPEETVDEPEATVQESVLDEPALRRSQRSNAGVRERDDRFEYSLSNISVKKGL